MSGGRPEKGRQHIYPELLEMAAWFQNALASAGYSSINAFVQRHLLDKNRVYALFKGTHLYPREVTLGVAAALVGPAKAEEVGPLWWRAKEARDRAAAAERERETPRLSSWDRLPWPQLALQDILDAQSRAAETLPYQRLGIEPPPLSTVYVRQTARVSPVRSDRLEGREETAKDGDRADEPAAEPAILITDTLGRHEHLIVIGEPGAGKSTFGQHLVLRLSQIWLRQASAAEAPLVEPVIPLRVQARALVGATSWSAALAQGVRELLGLLLVADPAPGMFEHRVHGARWLVVIDGIDEIVDQHARGQVIQAVAARCRPDSPYRVVVTSRHLPDAELAPLRAQNVGFYNVEPFGPIELQDFAQRWFAAQTASISDDAAARFLRHIAEGGRLRELVRNPLLATLAAIAYTLAPDRPLPASRLELYERFVACLLDDEASRRATAAELRRLEGDHPGRYSIATWIYQHRADLAAHLAAVRVDSEDPLLASAADWVRDHAPDDAVDAAPWMDDLRQLLIGTGLFIADGGDVRFWHHTLAEFLAAQAQADGIESSFPEVESWIARGLNQADRQRALFVMHLWARRPGNELSVIVDRLLAGRPERTILAAHLLAEAAAPEDLTDRMLERLLDLAIGSAAVGQGGQWYDMTDRQPLHRVQLSEIMEPLGQFVDSPLVAGRLSALADGPHFPRKLRIAAAAGLGRVAGGETAIPRLEMLARQATDDDAIEIARSIAAIAPNSTAADALLRRHVTDTHSSPGSRCQAALELAAGGGTEDTAQIALDLIGNYPLDSWDLRAALTVVLQAGDEYRQLAVSTVDRAAHLGPAHWVEAAEAYADAGLLSAAVDLARRALADPRCSSDSGVAVRLLLAYDPNLDLDHLVATIQARPSPWHRVWAAQTLATAGHSTAATGIARAVIADPIAEDPDVGMAAEVLLTAAGADALPEVLEGIRNRPAGLTFNPARAITGLVNNGLRDSAIALARSFIENTLFDYGIHSLRQVVDAWLAAAGPEAAPEIADVVRSRTSATADYWALAAEGFAERGCIEQAAEFSRRAFTVSGLYYSHPTVAAAKAWIQAAGPGAADEIIRVAGPSVPLPDRLAIADHFAAFGALRAAQTIWRATMSAPQAPMDIAMTAAIRLIQTGGIAAADIESSQPEASAVTIALRVLHAAISADTRE